MSFVESVAWTFKTSFSISQGGNSLTNHCLCTSTRHPVTSGRLWRQGNHTSSIRFMRSHIVQTSLLERFTWLRVTVECIHRSLCDGRCRLSLSAQLKNMCHKALTDQSSWSLSQNGAAFCAAKTASCIIAAWTISILLKQTKYFKVCYSALMTCEYTFASYLKSTFLPQEPVVELDTKYWYG